MKNDFGGSAAFPVATIDGYTLRDYFAGQALVGYASNKRIMDNAIDGWQNSGGERPTCVAEYLAGLAYEVADSMIVARDAK